MDILGTEGERWLDVGCGIDKVPGAIGIDRIKLPEVDVVHDLNVFPWPFGDNYFDHIVCKHSLSHLNDLVGTIEEIFRISKPDSILEILAPHYASDNFNTDPTHNTDIDMADVKPLEQKNHAVSLDTTKHTVSTGFPHVPFFSDS